MPSRLDSSADATAMPLEIYQVSYQVYFILVIVEDSFQVGLMFVSRTNKVLSAFNQ